MKRRFALSMILTSGFAAAQENCGYKISDQRSGFKAGEQSDFVPLPPENTPLSLTIASPTEGEIVPLDQVQVFGSLTGPSNTGVMVSEELARSNATQFTIRPISLVPGANVITVIAKTLDGGTVTATRNITATPSLGADVRLQASLTGGYAPRRVSFALSTRLPASQTQVASITNSGCEGPG